MLYWTVVTTHRNGQSLDSVACRGTNETLLSLLTSLNVSCGDDHWVASRETHVITVREITASEFLAYRNHNIAFNRMTREMDDASPAFLGFLMSREGVLGIIDTAYQADNDLFVPLVL